MALRDAANSLGHQWAQAWQQRAGLLLPLSDGGPADVQQLLCLEALPGIFNWQPRYS